MSTMHFFELVDAETYAKEKSLSLPSKFDPILKKYDVILPQSTYFKTSEMLLIFRNISEEIDRDPGMKEMSKHIAELRYWMNQYPDTIISYNHALIQEIDSDSETDSDSEVNDYVEMFL